MLVATWEHSPFLLEGTYSPSPWGNLIPFSPWQHHPLFLKGKCNFVPFSLGEKEKLIIIIL